MISSPPASASWSRVSAVVVAGVDPARTRRARRAVVAVKTCEAVAAGGLLPSRSPDDVHDEAARDLDPHGPLSPNAQATKVAKAVPTRTSLVGSRLAGRQVEGEPDRGRLPEVDVLAEQHRDQPVAVAPGAGHLDRRAVLRRAEVRASGWTPRLTPS